MKRIELRVVKLEGGGGRGRYPWEGRPLREWPDHALAALTGEGEGWPPNYMPSDAVLRAAMVGADYDDDDGDAS